MNAASPSPARVVAVTRLLLDVLDDLSDRAPDSLSPAECDLLACLMPEQADIHDILTLARKEMNALAPAVLAI